MDGFDGSPELVRDIQLVGIKEENNPGLDLRISKNIKTIVDNILLKEMQKNILPVHSLGKPLEDADEIVASVDSLFLSREDSRGVDHRHTLQHWALYDRALEPENSSGTWFLEQLCSRYQKNILNLMETGNKSKSTC